MNKLFCILLVLLLGIPFASKGVDAIVHDPWDLYHDLEIQESCGTITLIFTSRDQDPQTSNVNIKNYLPKQLDYSINFGDGTVVAVPADNNHGFPASVLTHTYAANGNYTLSISVTDFNGETGNLNIGTFSSHNTIVAASVSTPANLWTQQININQIGPKYYTFNVIETADCCAEVEFYETDLCGVKKVNHFPFAYTILTGEIDGTIPISVGSTTPIDGEISNFTRRWCYGVKEEYTITIRFYLAPGESMYIGHQGSATLMSNSGGSPIEYEFGTYQWKRCTECLPEFSPSPGGQYVLQAWVKQDNGRLLATYSAPNITLDFPGSSAPVAGPFTASGPIIEGWQRIEEEFTIPLGATSIRVNLNNSGSDDVFFDDIRLFPFDANMSSYVYDPVSLKLVAELDPNNYATFYVYDEEGKLLKKHRETERGIKTLTEGRSGTIENP